MTLHEKHAFNGIHILGEMYGISHHALNDAEMLEDALKEGIIASGATLCGIQTKSFEPNGVTILALLSESHASIHTYPEEGALFFDAFTCGEQCNPAKIADALKAALKPTHTDLQRVDRGEKPSIVTGSVQQTASQSAAYR